MRKDKGNKKKPTRPTKLTTTGRAFADYLAADGLPQFQFYMDMLRRTVKGLEETYALEVQSVERCVLGRGKHNDYGTALGEMYCSLAETVYAIQHACPPGSLFSDLLIVATPPIDHTDTDRRLMRFTEELSRKLSPLVRFAEEFRPHLSAATLLSPQQLARDLISPGRRMFQSPSEDARVRAADRVLHWIGRAIHPIRWRWVGPALKQLARAHSQRPQAELRNRLLSALFEAVEVAGAYTLTDEQGERRALRARLNRLVTADVLGPDWRHRVARDENQTFEPAAHEPSPEATAEARLMVERLIATARLSPREAEVVAWVGALGDDYGAFAHMARQLRIKASTVRVFWSRARRKLLRAHRNLLVSRPPARKDRAG